MSVVISGIHHVTAICGDPQRNVDFYCGLLGLRLVKQTVNYDDPETYHLYYGDGLGSPGTILTFFPWPNAIAGRTGPGMVRDVVLGIPVGTAADWCRRLELARVPIEFDEGDCRLRFRDPDGLRLELTECALGMTPVRWLQAPVSPAMAIQGIQAVRLLTRNQAGTLDQMRTVLALHAHGTGSIGTGLLNQEIQLLVDSGQARGLGSVGTIHHVALRASQEDDLLSIREDLLAQEVVVTTVRDRTYFRSIYWREPGGVLFELATDGPGFTVDESPEILGTALQLPDWLEPTRPQILARLSALRVPR